MIELIMLVLMMMMMMMNTLVVTCISYHLSSGNTPLKLPVH